MQEYALSQRLRRGALWIIAWRVVGIVATLAANVLLARWLGPKEFGSYLFLTSVIAFGGILACSGLSDVSLRSISERLAVGAVGEAAVYLRRIFALAGLTSLLVALATAGMLALYDSASPGAAGGFWVWLFVAVGVAALGWMQIAAESLRGLHELRFASLFSGGQGGGPLSVLLGLIAFLTAAMWFPVSAELAVMLGVGALCVTLALALTCLHRTVQQRQQGHGQTVSRNLAAAAPSSRRLLSIGWVLMSIQLLAFVSQQFDLWIGEMLLEGEDLGIYGAAKRSMLLAAMPVQMAMLTVISTIPELHAQKRRGDLEALLRKSAFVAAVPAIAALVLLVCFPEQILGLIFGGIYAEAAAPLMILAIGHFVLIVSGNPAHVLTMTGHERSVVIVNLMAALVLVVAGPLAASQFGILGLAAASATSLSVQNIVLWWLAKKHVGVWTHVGVPSRPLARVDASVGVPPQHAVAENST